MFVLSKFLPSVINRRQPPAQNQNRDKRLASGVAFTCFFITFSLNFIPADSIIPNRLKILTGCLFARHHKNSE